MDKYYETSLERVVVCVPFLTRLFVKQQENIVLQTNFFAFSLHSRRNIFDCTNFCECSGLDISREFILGNERNFENALKNLEQHFDFAFLV